MPKVSVDQKGTAPDASDYIAFKRRQVLLRAHISKVQDGTSKQQPAVGGEFLLQKGFQSGVVDVNFANGKTLDQTRFNY